MHFQRISKYNWYNRPCNRSLHNKFIEETLRIWKNEKQRYPLLVRGARQVGKSYSIIKFGEKEFDNLDFIEHTYVKTPKKLFQL